MCDKSDLIQKLLQSQQKETKSNDTNLSEFQPEKLDQNQFEALMSQVPCV